MIKLTDRIGNHVYLDETRLCSVSRVYADLIVNKTDVTRIIVAGDSTCVLVTETPEEVMSATPIQTAEPAKGETSV